MLVAMAATPPGSRSITIGGNVGGGVIIAGDGNVVKQPSTAPDLDAAAVGELSDWDGSRLFLSHSHADRDLAMQLVRLFLATSSLEADDIFCSSLSGTGIPEGRNFVEYIREALVQARLVVVVITPSYLGRPFCLCELGAAWALELSSFPLLAGGTTVGDLDGVLGQVQASRLDDPDALDRLRDRLRLDLDGVTVDEARWPEARDTFLAELSSVRLGAG
jgi:hypothetical protein